jgi:hypothetical protein
MMTDVGNKTDSGTKLKHISLLYIMRVPLCWSVLRYFIQTPQFRGRGETFIFRMNFEAYMPSD